MPILSGRTARSLAGILPRPVRARLRARKLSRWPPRGLVRFGSLRRLTPISRSFGFDRGEPVDRHYIGEFLRAHGGPSGDIGGRVLEVGDDTYSRRFGGSRVDAVDILHVDATNPRATIVGDLAALGEVPSDRFDCIICTQTLLLVYDVRAAVATLARLLRPGGVVLATVPGISQICRPEMDAWGDHWRFTTCSCRRLFGDQFGAERVAVHAYGNVLAATAFLHGLSADELRPHELAFEDADYQVLIAIRAQKAMIDV